METGAADVASAQSCVFKKSVPLPAGSIEIKGYDFNEGIDYDSLLNSYLSTGFQASHMAQAVQQINGMLSAREEHFDCGDGADGTFPYPPGKRKNACTIFLGYTSNLVTSGVREV
ncbi:unnamed protein product [Gongylonema pulchrum]|uniref:Deoxyhypusine synthase n=1 Tax=Gongylonema pulchrum TaxID=637853 RepID=A0A183DB79_9BILA|nr:unnamed protein product [Gongylonema pulchrum]